jgi:succinate dehydrogenase / fumarate reductase, cytochrome b subunit
LASRPHNRPLSPHLSHYKWGPHMLVSILHRATGDGMAVVGTLLLVWWLAALASGKEAYACFLNVFTYHDGRLNIIGYVFGIGLTWALFQHIMSGLRHLVMDTGALFELKANRTFAVATMICSVLLTALFWYYILGVK